MNTSIGGTLSQQTEPPPGRARQKARTRRAILEAALRLKADGQSYTLEAVAEEAEVSRATIYRYFASLSALNAELALVVRIKQPDELLDPKDADPLRRLHRVHAHLFDLVRTHEAEFRAYIRNSMEEWERDLPTVTEPRRGGRRVVLIEAALEPLKPRMKKGEFTRLVQSLCLLTFFEPFVILKDIFGLSETEADRVLRWAIARLMEGVLPALT